MNRPQIVNLILEDLYESEPPIREYIEKIEQENDQLKSRLSTCPKCRGYDLERQWCDHCNKSGFIQCLAEHDAQVIENWLKQIPNSNRSVCLSVVRQSAQSYANQLRQKAQENQ